jgi:AAA15 family ATPase/GTPase
MIIEFSLENYRSVFAKQTLSFVAYEEEDQEDLDSDRTIKTGDADIPNLVRSAVVYGPNASGKSNLVGGLQRMKQLVLKSTRLSTDEFQGCYDPFKLDDNSTKAPTTFEMCMFIDGIRHRYYFSYDFGKIQEESLFSGEKEALVFTRNTTKNEWAFSDELQKEGPLLDAWQRATRENSLFITTAVELNSSQLKPVFSWFEELLSPDVNFFSKILSRENIDKKIEYPLYKNRVLRLLRSADIHLEDIRKIKRDEKKSGLLEHFPNAVSNLEFGHKSSNGDIVWFRESDESLGTQNILDYADILFDALDNGKFLIIDEIEKHLHPNIVDFIFYLFAEPDINRKGAQLLAITHNTNLLSSRVLERDQVWFIKKDDKQSTLLYPLTDFHVRENGDLERDYLAGRYGALPDVDYWGFEE